MFQVHIFQLENKIFLNSGKNECNFTLYYPA